ncbi:MAG: hypothetical protein GY828_01525 [Candidatus Gracilibacteria bacterium]|nr:hypothetical protein [Candidatus Gracilibacteria bacterium]
MSKNKNSTSHEVLQSEKTQTTGENKEIIYQQTNTTNENVGDILSGENLRPFYKKIILELQGIDIDTIPNERLGLIYKYIERIIKPLTKDAIIDIYNGRDAEYIQINEVFGYGSKKLYKDRLLKNQSLVSDYVVKTKDATGKTIYNHTEYFENKFEEYYHMYETIIVKRIQQEIEKNIRSKQKDLIHKFGEKEIRLHNPICKQEFRNIIVNIVSEFLYVIYAFGDKLDVNKFENLFLKQNKDPLQKEENNDAGSSVEGVVGMTGGIVKVYNSLQEYPNLLDMYKSFIMTGLITEGNVISYDYSKLAHEIEQHFQNSLNEIADIYKHWYYSEDARIDDLIKVRELLDKYIQNISILKGKDLAFSELNIYDIGNQIENNTGLGTEINTILGLEDEKKGFVELVQYLDKEDLSHLNKRQFNNLQVKNITGVHKQIHDRKGARKKEIHFTDISNTPLEEMDFSTYNDAGPDNRKLHFLKYVYQLNIDGFIVGNHFQQIKDDEMLYMNFVIDYVQKHKGKNVTEDNVMPELENALKMLDGNDPIHVLEFEKKYLHYEQILVSWFRYCLHSKDGDGKYERQLHGPREKIGELMTQLGLIDTEVLFTDGELKNSTLWNIDELISNYNMKFRKRPINLKSYNEFGFRKEMDGKKYDLYSDLHGMKDVMNNGVEINQKFKNDQINADEYIGIHEQNLIEKKKIIEINRSNNLLFKDIPELYIPKKNTDISEYSRHIKGFMDFTDLVLQRKEYNIPVHAEYIEVLKKNGIPIHDLETMYKLKKFFKYIEYIIPLIHELREKSIQDFFAIEKFNETLSPNMLDDHNEQIFEIGKPKTLNRIFEKVISSYSGDIREIGDLVRMRYIGSDLEDTYEKLVKMIQTIYENDELNEFIVQGIVEDNIGNNSERGPKETQYRDLKIQFKTNQGNLIEVQFMVKEIYEWKEIGLPEIELKDTFAQHNIYLDQDFITELENRAIIEKVSIPLFFKERIQKNVVTNDGLYQKHEKVNGDYLYKLGRGSNSSEFATNIKYMESLVYQKQWGQIISKQTKSNLNKILSEL